MGNSITEKLLDSGISPLELVKYNVLSCEDGEAKGVFTELHINSLELGTLTPAQYRVVTNRNNQSLRLSTWAFRRIVPMLSDEKEKAEWISFYIPSKALMRGNLKKLLENEQKKSGCDFSRLVAELSSEILYEDAESASGMMAELKEEFGIRFLLSEFGDEYSPLLRLPLYPFDLVLLDSSVDGEKTLRASSAAVRLAKQYSGGVIMRIEKPIPDIEPDASPDLYIPGKPISERSEF
ncbi:MAG: EAL domain-containing protein [Eubacteriales bacterium]